MGSPTFPGEGVCHIFIRLFKREKVFALAKLESSKVLLLLRPDEPIAVAVEVERVGLALGKSVARQVGLLLLPLWPPVPCDLGHLVHAQPIGHLLRDR